MIIRNNSIFFLLIIFVFAGCSKEDSAPTETPDPPSQITKSYKRGLAYNLTNAADLDTLKSGVSWWYDWSMSTSAPSDLPPKRDQ